eukprot:2423299-Prymnesium_polylepis.1
MHRTPRLTLARLPTAHPSEPRGLTVGGVRGQTLERALAPSHRHAGPHACAPPRPYHAHCPTLPCHG